MKIYRNVNGQNVEIELNETEIYSIYEYAQHKYDKQDIEDLYSWLDPEEIEREWHITKAKLDAGLDEMAYQMRRNIDKYDMHWDSARDEAFSDYLTKHAC